MNKELDSDFYYIDKTTGRVISNPAHISGNLAGTVDNGLEKRYRIRGGAKSPLDIVLGFIFKIFDPIVKPIRGIVDAILLIIKAVAYVIMLIVWFIRVTIWFFVEVLPTIPGDIWALVKLVTYSIFNILFGSIKLLFKKVVNKGGALTIDAIGQGWDNVPEEGETPNEEETGFYKDYISCRGKKCYVTEEGTIPGPVIMATILCPPLGVFMEYGATSWLQILITLLLTLAFYVPGLMYALILLYC
jgi:uncharacterized membrane protein YqaE (UPF0057 family)